MRRQTHKKFSFYVPLISQDFADYELTGVDSSCKKIYLLTSKGLRNTCNIFFQAFLIGLCYVLHARTI